MNHPERPTRWPERETTYADSTPACPTGTIAASTDSATMILPARCRRWRCERCGRQKARVLSRRAAATSARRLITLTARTSEKQTPEWQLDQLNHAWRTIWKRIKRAQGERARGYIRIVELTARGTPHLHIAVDCDYVPQRTLSAWMAELTGWPIVDVREIKSARGLARYLAKYLTKSTTTLAHRRKWSATPGWLPEDPEAADQDPETAVRWAWVRAPVETVRALYLENGYSDILGPGSLITVYPPET